MFRIGEFRFLFPLMRREWPSFVVGTSLVFLTIYFMVWIPRLVGEAIHRLETGSRVDLIGSISLAIIGVVLLRGITSFWMRRTMISCSRRIEHALRGQFFRHLETLDSAYFTRFHTGDLMSRFTSDIDAIRMAIGPGVMYTINTLVTRGDICEAAVSMASSTKISSVRRQRILANAQAKAQAHKTSETPEVPAEEDTNVATRDANSERILSKPVTGKSKKSRRKKSPGRSTTQIVLLAVIGIGGIAAIIALRYLSEAVGVNWIGE